MREILFRGKRVDNGEWANGNYVEKIHYYDGSELPCIQVIMQKPSVADRFVPCFETELVEVIPETVGQYTGIKDKNGKMIFEGDIVAFTAEDELWEPRCYNEGTVYFCDGTFWVDCGKDSDDCDVLFSIGHAKLCDESLQIIGNIHDNPMMLEV